MKDFNISYLSRLSYNSLIYISLVIFTFFLPFRGNISSVISILIFALFFFNFKELKRTFTFFLRNKNALFFSLLFVIHLLGLIYTSNFKFAFTDLEIKLPLFFFPIIIASRWEEIKKYSNTFFFSFVFGCAIATLISISNSFIVYFKTNDVGSFFYGGISYLMHSSYYAMYLCLAIVLSVYLLEYSKNKLRLFLMFLIGLFVVNIILLSSRAGLLMLGITFFMGLLYFLYKRKYNYVLIVSFTMLVSIFFILNFAPKVIQRFQKLNSQTVRKVDITKIDDINSRDTRLVLAELSLGLIRNNPILGVGTGDVKDVLLIEYKKNNFKVGIDQKLNCHNQYLQFMVTFGLIGIFVFIFGMYYPLLKQIRMHNWLFVYFIILVSINFLFESILETKAGVEFYAFFSIITLLSGNRKILKVKEYAS